MEKKNHYPVVSVIDIGSNAIRMDIAEIREDGTFRILESLTQSVRLGLDSFTTKKLSKQSIQNACNALADFKKVMDSYKVSYSKTLATAAVREASNSASLINRVIIMTDIEIDIINDSEELRLNYMATLNTLKQHPELANKNAIIIDLGAGGTEATALQHGAISASKNFQLGTLRMLQSLKTYQGRKHTQFILQSKIKNTIDLVAKSIPLSRYDFFIARGADLRRLARIKKWHVDKNIFFLSKTEFIQTCEEMLSLSVDELVQGYELNYNEAETIYPAALTFKHFAEAFQFDQVLIPVNSMRHGMILDLINQVFGAGIESSFSSQIVNSAIELSKKYRMDINHALHVARLSVTLFDKLKDFHGLKTHDRFLLEIAAIVHDIGSFINEGKHHLHSYYLVSNAELIGLCKLDMDIVANLVRYHRNEVPSLSDECFLLLDRVSRIKVYKLAALLRVADACDRSHTQVVRDFTLRFTDEKMVIVPTTTGLYEYEKLAIKSKSNLFESVYGLEVALQ